MTIHKSIERMEGWLYVIRSNRFGLQFSRKSYFILEEHCLKSFKSIPRTHTQEPLRSAIVDSCIRVTDNGRESFNRKVFFTFTMCNTSNHNDRIKLAATSPEEAARWVHSLQDVAMEPGTNSERRWQPFRLNDSKCANHNLDATTSDVTASSQWKIFGCKNGLRLFKEARDISSSRKNRGDHSAIMAVGVVEGTSEAVFQTLMSLGPSRTEWDFCFHRGNVVEQLDGHTNIIHMELYRDWLPWGMKRRDLLLRRYWRREDDGSYVILFYSVIHRKCPPQEGYVRAWIQSGGFVVSPLNQGKESVVKHMLSVDWKLWKSYFPKKPARSVTIHMLGRISALRELFRARSSDFGLLHGDKEQIKEVVDGTKLGDEKMGNERNTVVSGSSGLMELNEDSDEFFDVPEPSDDEPEWSSETSPQHCYTDLEVQKKGHMESQDPSRESTSYSYGSTFPKDSNFNQPCSWAASDPSLFLVRGKKYLKDRQKNKAKGTLMQMVAADWLRSNKREDDIAGRPGGLVQKYAVHGGPEFFFVVNIQVPGSPTYHLALYYMMSTPLEGSPLLERFVNGDDSFRNSRFKLIPYITKGSWLVKQSVGKKACLVGQALEVNYFRGKNYLELDIDVGSSQVARGVTNLVLGYLNKLVVEMAFLIQANTEDELPETLLGTCRLNRMDVSKSIPIESINV